MFCKFIKVSLFFKMTTSSVMLQLCFSHGLTVGRWIAVLPTNSTPWFSQPIAMCGVSWMRRPNTRRNWNRPRSISKMPCWPSSHNVRLSPHSPHTMSWELLLLWPWQQPWIQCLYFAGLLFGSSVSCDRHSQTSIILTPYTNTTSTFTQWTFPYTSLVAVNVLALALYASGQTG